MKSKIKLHHDSSLEDKSFSKTSPFHKSVALMEIGDEKNRLAKLEEKIEAIS